MELTNEQYTRIVRYLSGGMDEKEKAFFEAMMRRDEALRSEVDGCREMQSVFESASQKVNDKLEEEEAWAKGNDDIRALLVQTREDWEKEAEAETASVKNSDEAKDGAVGKGRILQWRWKWLAMAATIAGGIWLAVLLYVRSGPSKPAVAENRNEKGRETATVEKPDSLRETPPPPDAQKLFAAYFMPDAPPATADKLLNEPLAFYRNKKFDEAAEAFQMAKATLDIRSLPAANGRTRFYVHYYLAQARLASDKHLAESIGELKQAVKEAKSEAFKSKAQWYLSLAYLKEGNTAEAKKQLAQLTTADNRYKQRAQELAAQLNGK